MVKSWKAQAVPLGLLAVVYFATIFFGGVHVWSRSILILSIFAAFCAVLLIRAAGAGRSAPPFRIISDPPSLIGLLFIIWTALQLVPLPPGMLYVLSPRALALWETARIGGGTHQFTASLYPYMTAKGLALSVAVLLFYWTALYGLKDPRRIGVVIIGLIVLGNLEALYAMVQLLTGMPYVLWWEQTFSEKVATGTFIDRNHLAGFLSMLICLAIGYFWATGKDMTHGRRKRRLYERLKAWTAPLGARGIVLVLSVVLMTAALLTTASRGGVLSLLGGIAFMFGLVFTRYFRTGKAAVFAIAVFAGLIYTGYIASDRVLERFHFFAAGLENRLAMARETVTMGEDFPNTGAGLGTFEFVFPGYQKTSVEGLVNYAHNDWAQLFAESGWPGLLILGGGFLWFLGACVIRWRQRHNPFSVGIGLGGMGAFVAIALHSLSEFNLHMPANALLLALITALLYRALYFEGHNDVQHPQTDARRIAVPRPLLFGIVVLVLLAEGALAVSVLRDWRADMLARTVWNSTIPATRPKDEDIVQAWRLAPGNATYWSMMAATVSGKPKLLARLGKEIPPRMDADIYFLTEGVKRNPTSWVIWRNLGWAALTKMQRDPVRYLPLARNAFNRARGLRPYAPRGHFEYGMAGLQAEALQPGKNGFMWKEAFRTALKLNPLLATRVADQLVLYLGPQGAATLKELLPVSYRSYRLAADYFFLTDFIDAGLDLLTVSEEKRDREAAALWQEYRQKRLSADFSEEEKNSFLSRILSLDPRHPRALLAKGKIISALRNQERTGRRLGDLEDLAELASELDGLEGPDASPADIAYFKGRLAEEGRNYEAAAAGFRKALSLTPSYFPALLHLRALSADGKLQGTNHPGDENLDQQIRFYGMERVQANSWQWTGLDGGWPSWTAPFRVARTVKEISLRFSGNGQIVSKLILDGRLVECWKEPSVGKSRSVTVLPGEHTLRISQYRTIPPAPAKILPFEMQVDFVFE
jgi:tetratricopeptide (TPR) repeat protein